jgi:hypothetical protein
VTVYTIGFIMSCDCHINIHTNYKKSAKCGIAVDLLLIVYTYNIIIERMKKMLSFSALIIIAFVLIVPSVAEPSGIRCPPVPWRKETCVCQIRALRGVIDMTSLSYSNGSARYIFV